MEKFLEVKGAGKTDAVNDWFQSCRNRQVPFVTLTVSGNFANVHWDYITYNTEIEGVLVASEDELNNGFMEIFHRYALKNSTARSSTCFIVDWSYLDLANARLAAAALYDFIYAFLAANKKA